MISPIALVEETLPWHSLWSVTWRRTFKARLRVLAAEHGRSIEEEVRAISRQAIEAKPPSAGLGTRMAARFAKSGLRDSEALPDVREGGQPDPIMVSPPN